MTKKLTTFDPAELLTSDEAIAAFLADAQEAGDAGYLDQAYEVMARARMMNRIRLQTPN
jgi:probable addiction module antidote protein